MADAEEIQEAIDAARAGGCKELAILHCVSGYPLRPRTTICGPVKLNGMPTEVLSMTAPKLFII